MTVTSPNLFFQIAAALIPLLLVSSARALPPRKSWLGLAAITAVSMFAVLAEGFALELSFADEFPVWEEVVPVYAVMGGTALAAYVFARPWLNNFRRAVPRFKEITVTVLVLLAITGGVLLTLDLAYSARLVRVTCESRISREFSDRSTTLSLQYLAALHKVTAIATQGPKKLSAREFEVRLAAAEDEVKLLEAPLRVEWRQARSFFEHPEVFCP